MALVCVGAMTSCNEKTSSSEFIDPANVAVKSFSLKKVTTDSGLDSVYFSIDLNRGVIYNADSLPKGTAVNKLVANITFGEKVEKAIIKMEGGTTRTDEFDYKENPTDSIDFTGNVTMTVEANDGEMKRTYRLKVNVHQEQADSLVWGEAAMGTLPSRFGNPAAQKTVSFNDITVCLLRENNGSYTLSKSRDISTGTWDKESVTFPFSPQIESLAASENALYILSTDGTLYSSADMRTWLNTGKKWHYLIGSYLNTVVGLTHDGSQYKFAQYPMLDLNETEIPAGFPISDGSNFVTLANKWTNSPVAFFTGGIKSDGRLSDGTWAFDGTNWICLSTGGIPALEGASIIPYYSYRAESNGAVKLKYSVWMLVGGKMENGDFNRPVYISYDNGITWNKGTETLQLPAMIPAMTNCDNVVISHSKSANLSEAWKKTTRSDYTVSGDMIYWECPYIYLIGGYDTAGKLYDTIWRGVLTRLSFAPIF